jgi:hypothetical protein
VPVPVAALSQEQVGDLDENRDGVKRSKKIVRKMRTACAAHFTSFHQFRFRVSYFMLIRRNAHGVGNWRRLGERQKGNRAHKVVHLVNLADMGRHRILHPIQVLATKSLHR